MDQVKGSRVERVSRKRKKKWGWRIGLITLVFILGIGSYFGWQMVSALNQSQDKTVGGSQLREKPVEPKKEPFAILLLGTDAIDIKEEKNPKKGWRPDVIMVAAVNPKTKSIKLVSIPRDTYVPIAHTKGKDKINAAKSYGKRGVENIRDTVENLFGGIPIDYYAKINFQGFVDIVDAVGGVDVNNKYEFKGPGIHTHRIIKAGPQHLDGMNALAYVRQRKDEKNVEGDIDRNRRQQEVISQVVDQIISGKGITSFPEITKAVGENFSFNMSFTDIPAIAAVYQQIPKENIQHVEFKTYTQQYAIINGKKKTVWWERYNEQDRQAVEEILKQQLEWVGSGKENGTKTKTGTNP